MAEEKAKNLCAQIPVDLHGRVRQEQERSGKTLGQYMTWLITEFYNIYERKGSVTMEDFRTLAVQIPVDLMKRLDEYLDKHHLTKKKFVTDLIQTALEQDTAD